MTDELNKKISALRNELARTDFNDTGARQHLQELLAEIEKLEESRQEDNQPLTEEIRDAIARFETEHPRATAILNDIMVTLSNMGI